MTASVGTRRRDGRAGIQAASSSAQRSLQDAFGPPGTAIDWPRTLVARGPSVLKAEHLRHRPASQPQSELHCFLLDCSASMRVSGGLARAKGLLLELMAEAYRGRHRVALLCFAGGTVELRLAPRRAAAWNEDWIAPIAGGGGTPLALGAAAADRLLRRSPASRRALWVLTDGRSREKPPRPVSPDSLCIIDFESDRLPLARAAQLAGDWQADYRRYQDL